MIQLSHPYMTTGKTIALTIKTFVSKVMFLLFNRPSMFLIAFLPRSKYLLISWLQSSSTVILELKKIKFVTFSTLYIISLHIIKLLSIESLMPYNYLILCPPLLLPPSVFPSIRVFSNESAFPIRWPKYWSFSFSISPSNEYSGLISFRID